MCHMCAYTANSAVFVWNQKFIPFPIFQGAYRIFKPKTRWIMIQWSFVIFRNLSGWKIRLSPFLENFVRFFLKSAWSDWRVNTSGQKNFSLFVGKVTSSGHNFANNWYKITFGTSEKSWRIKLFIFGAISVNSSICTHVAHKTSLLKNVDALILANKSSV